MCELGHKNIAKAQLSQLKYLRGPLMMDLIQNIVDSIHNSPVSLSSPLPYCRLFKLQHVSQLLPLGHVDGQDNLLAGGHEAAAATVTGIVAVDCVIAAAAVARVVGPSAV